MNKIPVWQDATDRGGEWQFLGDRRSLPNSSSNTVYCHSCISNNTILNVTSDIVCLKLCYFITLEYIMEFSMRILWLSTCKIAGKGLVEIAVVNSGVDAATPYILWQVMQQPQLLKLRMALHCLLFGICSHGCQHMSHISAPARLTIE